MEAFFLVVVKLGRRGEKALVRKIHSRTIAKFKAGKTLLSSWKRGCYALVGRSKNKRQKSVKRRALQ